MDDDELVGALEEDGAPEAPENELDRLDPQPDEVTLACGITVHVLPLRTRQLFKMLRIITHGAGQALQNAGLDFADESGVFMQKLVGIVLFSIPDAEQETIEFIQSMVEPAGLVDKMPGDLNKQERERNIELWTAVNKELWNPDPGDTIDLVENIITREAKDIQALGKKVSRLIELASKTGQLDKSKSPASPAPKSSASSAASSTSSRASTGGRTSKSSTSRSAASAKSAGPSSRASGKRSATADR